MELSLQAELASDYFSLRGADATIAAARRHDQGLRPRVRLSRSNRYQEGIAAATDVDQADTQRQNARAQLAAVRLRARAARACHRRAAGTACRRISRSSRARWRRTPPASMPGCHRRCCERRPDVGRAERAMAAANAQIGVARAAWFPVFTLTGSGGYESILAASWFRRRAASGRWARRRRCRCWMPARARP